METAGLCGSQGSEPAESGLALICFVYDYFVCTYVCVPCVCSAPKCPEVAFGSPGTGVKRQALAAMGLGTEFLCKNGKHL